MDEIALRLELAKHDPTVPFVTWITLPEMLNPLVFASLPTAMIGLEVDQLEG